MRGVRVMETLFDTPNSIELRKATFDDDAEMSLTEGLVLTSFKRLGIALEDDRCKRPHLRVLHYLMRHLNHTTGTAYCSRRTVGQDLDLGEKTVDNVLYELRQWGHIDWQRRAAPDQHPGRRLLHYVLPVCRWSEDEITAAIRKIRASKKVPALKGTKSTRPDGQFFSKVPVLTGTQSTRPNGQFLNGSARSSGQNEAKSTRQGGCSNSSIISSRRDGFLSDEAKALVERAVEAYNDYARRHKFQP
jgi:hypothetical protein